MKTEVVILEIIKLAALFLVGYWAFMANRKVAWVKDALDKEKVSFQARFQKEFELCQELWALATRYIEQVYVNPPPWPEINSIRSDIKKLLASNAPFLSERVHQKALRLLYHSPRLDYSDVLERYAALKEAIEERIGKLG